MLVALTFAVYLKQNKMKQNNHVVRITRDDDGEKKKGAKWCLIDPCNYQGRATLCTAEFFGEGESNCEYETKVGNITCPDCIAIITRYKKIKL